MAEGDIRVLRENAGGSYDEVRLQDYISSSIVANPGDNRVITSDGTTGGLNAETNLLFNGSMLEVRSDGAPVIRANGAGYTPYISFYHSQGSYAAPSVTVDGDIMGEITFAGFNGTDYSVNSFQITVTSEDTFTSAVHGCSVVFSTAPEGVETAPVERLKFTKEGRVRVNGAYEFPTAIGSAGQVLQVPTSGTVLEWATPSGGGISAVTDGIFDLDMTGGTLTVTPYTSKAAGHFYTGTTSPTDNSRLNWSGYLYATAFLAYASGSITALTGSTYSGWGVYGISTTGYGVYGQSTSSAGVLGTSTNGVAGSFSSANQNALYLATSPASTNTIQTIVNCSRFTGGTAAAGIGQAILYYIEATSGAGVVAGSQHILFTDVTLNAETAAFEWWLRNAGTAYSVKMSLGGPGDLTIYGWLKVGNAYTLPSTIGSVGQVLKVPESGTLLEWYTPAGVSVDNQGNDRIVTATGTANTLNAEANFTYGSNQVTLTNGLFQQINVSDTLYGEYQFYRARASYANLSMGDLVGNIRWTGAVDSASKDLAYIEGIYAGDGTTQLGQLVLSINNQGTKSPAITIDAKAGVVIDYDQGGYGFTVRTIGRTDTLRVHSGSDSVGIRTANPASSFELQGSLGLISYPTTSSITLRDYVWYYTSTAGLTFTLPAPTVYRTYIIWNRSSGTLTLARNASGNTINGSAANLSIAAGYAYIVGGESSSGWVAMRIN